MKVEVESVQKQLARWGAAKTFAADRIADAADNPRQHIIDRLTRFAPKTRKRAQKKILGRDGEDRRRIVASKARIRGMPVVPMWAVDPIRCTQTRVGGPIPDRQRADIMPAELIWIDRALDAMAKNDPVAALVLRVEYTKDGTQQERAKIAARVGKLSMTFWQYRKELDRAVAMLEGFRLAA